MKTTVTITFSDAWTYSPSDVDKRLPLSALPEDGRGHIHGSLKIRIAGRRLPMEGFFFEKGNVCLGIWLVELRKAVSALSAEDPAEYVYDEGEEGQPAYAFVRRQDLVLVSIIDSAFSYGKGLPDWEGVECRLTDFVAAVQQLETEIRQLLLAASPVGGERWLEMFCGRMR